MYDVNFLDDKNQPVRTVLQQLNNSIASLTAQVDERKRQLQLLYTEEQVCFGLLQCCLGLLQCCLGLLQCWWLLNSISSLNE